MTQITTGIDAPSRHAALDEAHVGDIRGVFGTTAYHDIGARDGWRVRLRTPLAILGPDLIMMVGDNDAGTFGTYTQAGQGCGATPLWTLMLFIPVLYVNQEMVLCLGAVTRVGHAWLIFARFSKFRGSLSVVDLFSMNALTLVTEFIGISLTLEYLSIPRHWGVCAAVALVMLAVSADDFRRFERFTLALVVDSLTSVLISLLVYPPMGQMARDFFMPALPVGALLAKVTLPIIAIVGTTAAPQQLPLQQSYAIDKRITVRFICYECAGLRLGIALVIAGTVVTITLSAQAFHGTSEFNNYTDALSTAHGLGHHSGCWADVLSAIVLLGASIISAYTVSLLAAYVIGDVFAVRHSLYRKPTEVKGFYAVYFRLTLSAAGPVLILGMPPGSLTSAMQSLAGVLLPSATVLLSLLCNDKAMLSPWTNGRVTNLFTGAVVAVLVVLSTILTVAVLFPRAGEFEIGVILIGGSFITVVMSLVLWRIE